MRGIQKCVPVLNVSEQTFNPHIAFEKRLVSDFIIENMSINGTLHKSETVHSFVIILKQNGKNF